MGTGAPDERRVGRPGDTGVPAPHRRDVDCPLYPDQYGVTDKGCACPRCKRIRWHVEWRDLKSRDNPWGDR